MSRPSLRVRSLEAAAASLMVIGAMALVTTFFPIINPGVWRTMTKRSEPSLVQRYSIGIPIATVIIGGAFYFNRRAQNAKKGHARNVEPKRKG